MTLAVEPDEREAPRAPDMPGMAIPRHASPTGVRRRRTTAHETDGMPRSASAASAASDVSDSGFSTRLMGALQATGEGLIGLAKRQRGSPRGGPLAGPQRPGAAEGSPASREPSHSRSEAGDSILGKMTSSILSTGTGRSAVCACAARSVHSRRCWEGGGGGSKFWGAELTLERPTNRGSPPPRPK